MSALTPDEAKLVERLRGFVDACSGHDITLYEGHPAVLVGEAIATIISAAEERERAELDRDKFHAIAEDKLADTRLVGAGGRGEGFGFDMTGGPIPYIAEYLFQFIGAREEKGPSNYAEIEVQHNTFGAMTLTLQRRSGQTPHQLKVAAESLAAQALRERDEAREALKLHEQLLLINAVRAVAAEHAPLWLEAADAASDRARALSEQPDKERT